MSAQKAFAEQLYRQIRAAARERLLDLHTMTAAGNCQTSQAMAIFYSLFDPGESRRRSGACWNSSMRMTIIWMSAFWAAG